MHYFERLNIYTATIIHYMENLNKLPLTFYYFGFVYVFAYYFIIKRDLSCYTLPCRVYIYTYYYYEVNQIFFPFNPGL